MTYIKNTITRLEDWLNDLPQDSTFCKVSNRVELLNKTIARHAEKNINWTHERNAKIYIPWLCRALNVDWHSPGTRRVVGTLTKHYLEEAGYVVHVIDPFTITYNIEYFITA